MTAVNMVFLLMKTMFDCIARIAIFSTWLYVTNNGRFSSSQSVIAYYSTFILLVFFNIIFNKTDDYCSLRTWIGIYIFCIFSPQKSYFSYFLEILLNSFSSILSYNVFDFGNVFDKSGKKNVKYHESSFFMQMLYFMLFFVLNLGYV